MSFEKKTNSDLINLYQDLLKDAEYLDGKAKELCCGAAADYFGLAAQDARNAAELAWEEMLERGIIQ
jgi:hypothetical protein